MSCVAQLSLQPSAPLFKIIYEISPSGARPPNKFARKHPCNSIIARLDAGIVDEAESLLNHAFYRLADSCQMVGVPRSHRDVVETDNREFLWDSDSTLACRVDDSKRHNIVAAKNCFRRVGRGQKSLTGEICATILEFPRGLGMDANSGFIENIPKATCSFHVG